MMCKLQEDKKFSSVVVSQPTKDPPTYLTNLFKDALTSLPPVALAARIEAKSRLALANKPIISPKTVEDILR